VVERLWRYPIKSTGGERLDQAWLDERGLAGDRLWAVRDAAGRFGSGKNTRRFRLMPGLLLLGSRYPDGPGAPPELLDQDGGPVADADTYLRAYLGRDDVSVTREGEVSHVDQLPLSVLTTATLDWVRREVDVPVDERRFRPNVLVRTPPGTAPFVEDDWLGRTAVIGAGPRVEFVRASERCVMVNEAQPGLPRSSQVLRAIAAGHDNRLDALATVHGAGHIGVGDAVVLD
jgi:uncharacterized protein YcbX